MTSLPGRNISISRPIDGVLGVESVIAWRPELPAFLAAFPRPLMPTRIAEKTKTKALSPVCTAPTASKRYKGGIATDPLLTTRRFDQRRLGITPKPTMLAGNQLGFHAVVSHRLPLCGGGGTPSALCRRTDAARTGSFYAQGSSAVQFAPPSTGSGHRSCPRGTRHEPIVQNEAQPGSVETESQAARPGRTVPATRERSQQGRAGSGHPGLESDSSPPTRVGGEAPRTRHPTQDRPGPLSPPTLFRGPDQLSRRLSRPDPPSGAPGHPESALPPNHHQLGHPPVDRAPRVGSGAAGLALAPGPLYQRSHLDARYQYWLGPGQDSRRVGLGCPPPSARTRRSGSPSCALYRRGGGRVLDRRHARGVAQATHRADGPPRRLSPR